MPFSSRLFIIVTLPPPSGRALSLRRSIFFSHPGGRLLPEGRLGEPLCLHPQRRTRPQRCRIWGSRLGRRNRRAQSGCRCCSGGGSPYRPPPRAPGSGPKLGAWSRSAASRRPQCCLPTSRWWTCSKKVPWNPLDAADNGKMAEGGVMVRKLDKCDSPPHQLKHNHRCITYSKFLGVWFSKCLPKIVAFRLVRIAALI